VPAPDPTCTVKDGAGAPQATTNGVNVTAANTITIALVSTTGVNTWSISVVGTDELVATPALTIDSLNKTATFTAPAAPWSLLFESKVNGGELQGVVQSSYTTRFKVCCLTGGGLRLLATGEKLENHATFGWASVVNGPARVGAGTAVTWANDLAGSTNTSQKVVQLTGDGSSRVTLLSGTHLACGPGSTYPTAGTFRWSHASGTNNILIGRNVANSTNINILTSTADTTLVVGDGTNWTNVQLLCSTTATIQATTIIVQDSAEAFRISVNSGGATTLRFKSSVTGSVITQESGGGGTGAALTVQAQGMSTTGGDLYLSSGTGGTANGKVHIQGGGQDWILAEYNQGGVAFFTTAGSYGSGNKVIFINNASTNPSTNPTGGGILYSDAGAGKWRGSGGTTTTFGPAEPHCPRCNRDYAFEWQNDTNGEHLAVCMPCLLGAIEKLGIPPAAYAITHRLNPVHHASHV